MRGLSNVVAVLCLLMLVNPGIALGEKKTRKQQEKDCDTAYDACIKGADDWLAFYDPPSEQNVDDYAQMVDGCLIRRKWCKQDITRSTRVGTPEATVPPQGGAVEPEPPKKRRPTGRPATVGGSGLPSDTSEVEAIPALASGMADNTDRMGSDYRHFELSSPAPEQCQKSCQADAPCKAWTYVRPSAPGASAVCYLKNPIPAASSNACCISGVK
jgi:hypothetical protein